MNNVEQKSHSILCAEWVELVEALEFIDRRAKQPGEDAVAHYERVADEFYEYTGMFAPGKSAPMELEATRDRTAEREEWTEFCQQPINNIRRVLAKVHGGKQ